MSTTTCGFISDTFPNGLRVLVIDDDSTFLLLLEEMLKTCNYEVTKCQRAMDALCILRNDTTKFDLVISNINMPDMDGFRLLEIISIDMDLPVVVTSSDDKKDVVMKVIIQGACDYLVKPIRLEVIQLLWQHVVRKREVQHDKMKNNLLDKQNLASLRNKENRISSNGGKDREVKEGVDKIGCISTKKSRMIWTDELRKQFATIVNQIGLKNAVPKKILELMNVPGLTRENVASHLQKYRLQLQKENENKQKGAKYTSLDQLHNCDMNSKRKFTTNNYNLQLPATTSPLSKSLTTELVHIGRPGEVFSNGMTLDSSTCNREVSLVATPPSHPAQNFGDTNVQVNGVVSVIQPLQTSIAMSSFENSSYNNLYEIQDGLSNIPIIQQPNKLQRLMNASGRGQGDGTMSHNVYEHAISFGTNPNASVRSNKNEAFFLNSSSGYEFGQDNFAIKPADKHYGGSAGLMATFGGYAAGNNFM